MITNTVDKVIMFLGDSGVGKSTLISNFIDIENGDIKKKNMSFPKEKEREKTICK